MTTLFPGALDDFSNPTSGTQLSAPGTKHHQQHTDLNDAVEAIEAYVGKTASTVTGSLTYQVNSLTTIVGTGSSGGVTDAQYLTLTAHTGLTVERVLTVSGTLSGTDNGAGQTYVVRDVTTGVASGTYISPVITVNAYGRLTFASSNDTTSNGLVRRVPLARRPLESMHLMDYVPEQDRVFTVTSVVTGGLYYVDRTMDYPVLLSVFSGRTPGTWIYSTIITGFLVSVGTNTAFTCTVTGGILVTGVTLGMQAGAAIRTTVTGKTIYTYSRGNTRVEMYDPASNTNLGTISVGSFGGQHGRSIVFNSGNDCMYAQKLDGDIARIDCTTNTVAATISGLGSAGGQFTGIVRNTVTGKLYGCSEGILKIWVINPSSDTIENSYDFPAGYHGSVGANTLYPFGNYIYLCCGVENPSVVLVFDAVNATWEKPLGTVDINTIDTAGPTIAGVLAEGILYVGTAPSALTICSGFYTYGRV